MRILVVGGAGYIGSHAVRLFLDRGHDVTVFDSLVFGHRAAVPAERLVVGDLADPQALRQAFARGFDAVVHFAAFAYVGESVTDPGKYWQNNVAGTLNLLDAARAAGVARIVFSSTCATYGVPASSPILEHFPQAPINPYGRTKLVVEWALADYAAAYGMGYAALRYFNAAGAHPAGAIGEDHRPETHLIPLAIDVALGRRAALDIFGTDYPTPDGTCVRDYIHVDDLAEAHLLAIERVRPGEGLKLNLGTGQGHSVRAVVASVERVSGRKVAVREVPRRAGDPPALVAAPDAAAKALGWTAQRRDLDMIVGSAWNWHSRHPEGYGDR